MSTVDKKNQPDGDIETQLRAAEEEAKVHYEKLLRVMAEFENFKKRMAKEMEERLAFANERLLESLLPTLDNLDRVLDHLPSNPSGDVKAITDGVELVRKGLRSTLEKFGVSEIEVLGKPFNPAEHEALAMVESPQHSPGMVVELHRRGFRLGDRLLRPALVTVARPKEKTT